MSILSGVQWHRALTSYATIATVRWGIKRSTMPTTRDFRADAVVVAEALVEMDILNEEGLHKLANLFRGIRAFSEPSPPRKPGNPPWNAPQEVQPENHPPAPEIPEPDAADMPEQSPSVIEMISKPQPAAA